MHPFSCFLFFSVVRMVKSVSEAKAAAFMKVGSRGQDIVKSKKKLCAKQV